MLSSWDKAFEPVSNEEIALACILILVVLIFNCRLQGTDCYDEVDFNNPEKVMIF